MTTLAAHCRAVLFAGALAAGTASGQVGAAPACAARSGPQTVALVELYTSEGCDSCPPADRWLSSTFPAGSANRDAAALAFHVDYWDRLGWKDRFAQPAFTARQYESMRANRSGLVYTPQVLVQGRELRGWRDANGTASLAAIKAQPARAEIVLEAEPTTGSIAARARARVAEGSGARRAKLVVALTESGLVSEVKTGENAGKRLVHDHVVRWLSDPVAVRATDGVVADWTLPWPAEAGTARTLVAFVQDVESGEVLQALALPCPPPR